MEKEPLKSTFPSVSYRGMLKLEEQFRNASSSTRTDMQFDSLVSPTNSKVAIPRIARSQSRNAVRRAKRACLGCRQKKAKCDGHQPCHQCVLFEAACEYAEGKEDRIKRRVVELEEQIDVYDQLLRRLRFNVDVHDREVTDRVLNRVGISLQSSYAIIPG
ncbi:hypothetical protein V6Z98_005597 [Aspergillus fumigatus]